MTTPSSAGWTAWSVDSLAAHLRGTINHSPDAPGGSVPNRIKDLVMEAAIQLWNSRPWKFRRRRGDLKVVANQSVIHLPSDFGELYHRWMEEQADLADSLRFTEDVEAWQHVYDAHASTDSGPPEIALISRELDDTFCSWQANVAPASDRAYTYPYWYLTLDPWSRRAYLETNTATANAGLEWRAQAPGAEGKNYTVALTAGGALAVAMSDLDIVVTFVSATTTAAEVQAAIAADATITAAVECQLASGHDGSGLVSAVTATNLAGPLATDGKPPWPATFHMGWRLLAESSVEQAYRKDEEHSNTFRRFEKWLSAQVTSNDQTIQPAGEYIPDGYDDLAHTTSASEWGVPWL